MSSGLRDIRIINNVVLRLQFLKYWPILCFSLGPAGEMLLEKFSTVQMTRDHSQLHNGMLYYDGHPPNRYHTNEPTFSHQPTDAIYFN
jgi:hypothetical protein